MTYRKRAFTIWALWFILWAFNWFAISALEGMSARTEMLGVSSPEYVAYSRYMKCAKTVVNVSFVPSLVSISLPQMRVKLVGVLIGFVPFFAWLFS
jgi:hypothetical protein